MRPPLSDDAKASQSKMIWKLAGVPPEKIAGKASISVLVTMGLDCTQTVPVTPPPGSTPIEGFAIILAGALGSTVLKKARPRGSPHESTPAFPGEQGWQGTLTLLLQLDNG